MEQEIEKECTVHGQSKFVLRKDSNAYRCRKCIVDATQKRRNKVKLMAIEYKGAACSICDYNKCVAALEFHHLDPTQKEFGIGDKGYTRSWDKIKVELDKCVLVCANCHREIHALVA